MHQILDLQNLAAELEGRLPGLRAAIDWRDHYSVSAAEPGSVVEIDIKTPNGRRFGSNRLTVEDAPGTFANLLESALAGHEDDDVTTLIERIRTCPTVFTLGT